MVKISLFLFLGALLFSCDNGISKARVCSYENGFDAINGCSKNIDEFNGVPETVVFSFFAKAVSENSKMKIEWFYEEKGQFSLIDSISYYTKVEDELLVSGMDRNFLQPGNYVVKAQILDFEETFNHEHKFTIKSSGEPGAFMLLVGDLIDPSGHVTRPKTYFDDQHARIYLSTFIYDAVPNSTIKITFEHKEKGKFSKTFYAPIGEQPKSKFLLFANLPNRDLPTGEYSVKIQLGKNTFSAPFFIDATQKSVLE